MDKIKKLEELKEELKNLKEYNRDSWMTYGSELCAGDMFYKESVLEDKIRKLTEEINNE